LSGTEAVIVPGSRAKVAREDLRMKERNPKIADPRYFAGKPGPYRGHCTDREQCNTGWEFAVDI